jgi:RHS repeat-associated protein
LLMLTTHGSPNTNCFVSYDGNGNVRMLLEAASGGVLARYECSAFGELLRATGPMAKANPFRFSTKHTDDETGLIYYGCRYFSPGLGRWVNRDPSEEKGGNHLLAFLGNNPLNLVDPLGQSKFDPTFGWPDEFWTWAHDPSNPDGIQGAAGRNPSKEDLMELYEEWKSLPKGERNIKTRGFKGRNRPPKGGWGGEGGYVNTRLMVAGAATSAVTIAAVYVSARLALYDVEQQMAQGISASTGSPQGNLFDLVRHAKGSETDAWQDLDAITYAIASGQTAENALVTWSALIDGAQSLSNGGD